MKMKKVISAIAALAMISSSLVSVCAEDKIVFEDITLGTKTFKAVKTIPTKEEVGARAVKLTVDAQPITVAELETETAEFDPFFPYMLDGLDAYKVTVKYSNLGELANGYNAAKNGKTLVVGARAWEFNITGEKVSAIKAQTMNSAQFEGGTVSQALVDGNLNTFYQATDTSNPYPTYTKSAMGNASYIENGEVTLVTYFAIDQGTTLTLTPEDYKATFMYTVGSDAQYASFTKPTIVIGASASAETSVEISSAMELTGSNEGKEVKGVAWDVTIKNYDSEKTYSATISDSTGVRGNGAVELSGLENISKIAETEGDIGFAVLVQLSKARTGLTLDVDFE